MYHHQCSSCGIDYIPFDDDVPCPKCGELEKERYDVITGGAASAQFNFLDHGSYIPSAWVVLSHGDAVMSIIFQLLELDRQEGSINDFSEMAREMLEKKFELSNEDYVVPYIHRMAVRVHKELSVAKTSGKLQDS